MLSTVILAYHQSIELLHLTAFHTRFNNLVTLVPPMTPLADLTGTRGNMSYIYKRCVCMQ